MFLGQGYRTQNQRARDSRGNGTDDVDIRGLMMLLVMVLWGIFPHSPGFVS